VTVFIVVEVEAIELIHGLDVPDWHYVDSLKTEYNSIGPRQQAGFSSQPVIVF
jgi:hypothetical protein